RFPRRTGGGNERRTGRGNKRRSPKLLRPLALMVVALTAMLGAGPDNSGKAVSLFDGKTLAGWQGDAKFWRVEDGQIVAGKAEDKQPHNDFLATEKSYSNFDLHLKLKLVGTEGFVNSGIQFRSLRVPNNFEMSGYQADAGEGYWGALYDETRRDMVLMPPMDPAALKKVFKPQDWNDYRVRADGPHIETWINGVKCVDYTEKLPNIAQDGHIGLQIHGSGKTVVYFKDITIEELPPTADAPTWEKLGGYKKWKK
ncbi:MAG TPA: DUF1080 domain-containing protein, partial [Tepidisphaeraceae bacterium]